ncbi:MAG: hypothetical protein AAB513_01870 [Patescibacteria group bacterium]
MRKKFEYIIVISIILQSIFGFVLPAQAQENDNVSATFNAENATQINNANTTIPSGGLENPANNPSNPNAYSPQAAAQEAQQKQEAAKNAKKTEIPELCTWKEKVTLNISECVGNLLLVIGGAFVGITGTFLNFSIEITVLQMSKFVNDVGVITAGWKTFRDLANMFFIFILIYIAIATIIGAASMNTRKSLVMVIIVALLINFSMFFTKVVIDASNILAIQFYNSISKGPSSSNNGFSWVFMNASRLTTLYPTDSSATDSAKAKGYKGSNILLIGFFGLIFGIILSFCFLAIGILFVIRFVVLLFLMMLSPIALLGLVVNRMGEVWTKWLNTLFREAIFAPTIMAMLWIIASIVNNTAFINAINRNGQTDGGFYNIIGETIKDSMAVAVNFGILIAMLIGALIISKNFSGSAGGAVLGAAEKWSRKAAGGMTFGAAGFAGRKSFGWAGNKLAENKGLERFAARNPFVGGNILRAAKGVASSSFDARGAGISALGDAGGKGGYRGILEAQVKERQRRATELKDVKIYSDEKTETEATGREEAIKGYDTRIAELNKKAAELRMVTPKDVADGERLAAERENIEKQRVGTINLRNEAQAKLKEIHTDQGRTKTGEQVYGEQLMQGPIAAVMKRLSAEREKSSKKIDEPYAKDRYKQETKYADDITLNRLDAQIEELRAQLERGAKAGVNASEAIARHTEELSKVAEKMSKVDSEVKWGRASNEEREVLKTESENLKKKIDEIQKNSSRAANLQKELLEKQISDLKNQKSKIKGKRATEKFREVVKEFGYDEEKKQEKPTPEVKNDGGEAKT